MTTLKLDIDYFDAIKAADDFNFRYELLTKLYDVDIIIDRIYETKKGFHIYAKINKELTDTQILLFQVFLGSDWKREAFNFKRVLLGLDLEEYNVLFSKKIRDGKIISEEKDGLRSRMFYFYFKLRRKLKEVNSLFEKSKEIMGL